MILKHIQTIIVGLLITVSFVLLVMIADSVNQPPIRKAYVKDGDTVQEITVRPVASLSDAKLINFVERVIVTCFSLTPINY